MIGAVLSGHREETAAWHEAGDLIGLAFQVQDDVLDATKTADELGKSNSDERNEKVTSVSLMGIDEAVKTMNELYDLAADKIRGFRDFSSDSLIGVLKGIQSRSK
jgi:geranylgeranyl pyrophosphate synthase